MSGFLKQVSLSRLWLYSAVQYFLFGLAGQSEFLKQVLLARLWLG